MFHAPKRHLPDSGTPGDGTGAPPAKRRLVDTLHALSLGRTGTVSDTQRGKNSSLFGTFTREELNKPLSDPNRVVIGNIDKFLHENPDQLDIIGERLKLEDIRNAGLDKLFISSGWDMRKAWNNIVSQYKNRSDHGRNTHSNVDDIIYRLIWEEYLAKYFSLIRYYNPLKVVWENYTKWLQRTIKPKLVELSNDGDDDMILDSDADFDIDGYDERAERLRDGMSSYGSYYTHDDDGLHHYVGAYAYADDDDVMMVD